MTIRSVSAPGVFTSRRSQLSGSRARPAARRQLRLSVRFGQRIATLTKVFPSRGVGVAVARRFRDWSRVYFLFKRLFPVSVRISCPSRFEYLLLSRFAHLIVFSLCFEYSVVRCFRVECCKACENIMCLVQYPQPCSSFGRVCHHWVNTIISSSPLFCRVSIPASST